VKKYLQEIRHLLGSEIYKLPKLIFLFLGVTLLDLVGLGLIGPYMTVVFDPQSLDGRLGEIVSSVGLPSDEKSLVIIVGVTICIVFMLKALSSMWINYRIIAFSIQQQVRLRLYLMRAYQSLPYTEYLRRNSSEYIHGMQVLSGEFSSGALIPILRTISDGMVALAILCLLAWTNGPVLILLATMLIGLVIGYDKIFRRRLGSFGEQINNSNTRMFQGIHEGIEGMKEIRILGKEAYFYNMVRSETKKIAHISSIYEIISMAPRHIIEVLFVCFFVALVTITLLLGDGMQTLLPTVGIFGVAALRLIPSVNMLFANLIQLRRGRNSISRLYNDLIEIEKLGLTPTDTITNKTDNTFESLKVSNVSFYYPKMKSESIKQISFYIKKGESVGLMGPSGSGKTTLVDILLGLLEPSTGAIKYNGSDLGKRMQVWRSQVAYLPQQVFIMDNTLRCNVALGVEENDIDDTRVNESLRQAFLPEVVEQLPEGIDTVLGERGVRLSGGQRQRVALARAFYHGRNVLVMDEATSALDNETEHEIVEEIRKLHGVKTLIVIAHRLTTLKYCDRIFKLENGELTEEGDYESIIGKEVH